MHIAHFLTSCCTKYTRCLFLSTTEQVPLHEFHRLFFVKSAQIRSDPSAVKQQLQFRSTNLFDIISSRPSCCKPVSISTFFATSISHIAIIPSFSTLGHMQVCATRGTSRRLLTGCQPRANPLPPLPPPLAYVIRLANAVALAPWNKHRTFFQNNLFAATIHRGRVEPLLSMESEPVPIPTPQETGRTYVEEVSSNPLQAPFMLIGRSS